MKRKRGVAFILSHTLGIDQHSLLIDCKQQETEIEIFVLLLPPDRK
jgi:hypothetical protein